MRSALYPILFRRSLLSRVFEALSHYSTKALYDPSDLTSIYQSRTGGSTGAVDSVVGIMLDKSEMGGKTAANFIAGQSELVTNGAVGLVGSATAATYNTTTGVGAATRVDASNQSFVQWSALGTNWYLVDIENTGANALSVRSGAHSGTIITSLSAGIRATVLLQPGANLITITAGGGSIAFTVHSFKAIPGYHALAPSDAARPILRAGYYLDTDGTDDWMNVFPTLNLGEQWWHVGGWKQDLASAHYPFALSNQAGGKGALLLASSKYNWRNSADAVAALNTTNPTSSAHVLTIEDDTNIAARYNGVVESAAFAPFDDSAATQELALFSAFNNTYSNGIDGRFYGGAFGTGTLTSTDRALLERYVAGLTGVTL